MLKNANVNVNGEYENLNLDLLNANKQNYLDFHKQIPGERFAQIQSYKIILKVLKEIKHIVPTLYKTEKQLLVNEMLEGYMPSIDKIDSPTKYFLANSCEENLHLLKSFNVFDDNVKEKYKLSKRLVYGLPISNEEYYYTRRLTY